MKKFLWPLALLGGIAAFSGIYDVNSRVNSDTACVQRFTQVVEKKSTGKDAPEVIFTDRTKEIREACSKLYTVTKKTDIPLIDKTYRDATDVQFLKFPTDAAEEIEFLNENEIKLTPELAKGILLQENIFGLKENIRIGFVRENFKRTKKALNTLGNGGDFKDIVRISSSSSLVDLLEFYASAGCKITGDGEKIQYPSWADYSTQKRNLKRPLAFILRSYEVATSVVPEIDCLDTIMSDFAASYKMLTGKEVTAQSCEFDNETINRVINFSEESKDFFIKYRDLCSGDVDPKNLSEIMFLFERQHTNSVRNLNYQLIQYMEMHNQHAKFSKKELPTWNWQDLKKAFEMILNKGRLETENLENALKFELQVMHSGVKVQPSLMSVVETAEIIKNYGVPDYKKTLENLTATATTSSIALDAKTIIDYDINGRGKYLELGSKLGLDKKDIKVFPKKEEIESLEETLKEPRITHLFDKSSNRGKLDWVLLRDFAEATNNCEKEELYQSLNKVDEFLRSKGYVLRFGQIINAIPRENIRFPEDIEPLKKIFKSVEPTWKKMISREKEDFIANLIRTIFQAQYISSRNDSQGSAYTFLGSLDEVAKDLEDYIHAVEIVKKYTGHIKLIPVERINNVLDFEKVPEKERRVYLSYFKPALGTHFSKVFEGILPEKEKLNEDYVNSLKILRSANYKPKEDEIYGLTSLLNVHSETIVQLANVAELSRVKLKIDKTGIYYLQANPQMVIYKASEYLKNPAKEKQRTRRTMNIPDFLGYPVDSRDINYCNLRDNDYYER